MVAVDLGNQALFSSSKVMTWLRAPTQTPPKPPAASQSHQVSRSTCSTSPLSHTRLGCLFPRACPWETPLTTSPPPAQSPLTTSPKRQWEDIPGTISAHSLYLWSSHRYRMQIRLISAVYRLLLRYCLCSLVRKCRNAGRGALGIDSFPSPTPQLGFLVTRRGGTWVEVKAHKNHGRRSSRKQRGVLALQARPGHPPHATRKPLLEPGAHGLLPQELLSCQFCPAKCAWTSEPFLGPPPWPRLLRPSSGELWKEHLGAGTPCGKGAKGPHIAGGAGRRSFLCFLPQTLPLALIFHRHPAESTKCLCAASWAVPWA